MPCQFFLLRNAQIVKKYPTHQNVRGPPEHSAIGNIIRDILLLGIMTLQHVIQNNGWWV